jgi:hypothetical protein
LSTLPEPDSSPARRPEPILDVSVPHRAGAIVSEFISSIVGEAESRAGQIVVAAEEEAAPRRQAALDSATRVRECQDALSQLLAELRRDLQRESDILYTDPRIRQYIQQPGRLLAAAEPEVHVQEEFPPDDEVVDASVEEEEEPVEAAVEEEPLEEAAVEEEPVEEDEPAEATAEEAPVEEVIAEPVVEEPTVEAPTTAAVAATPTHDPGSRFERMTDEELARAHANAVKAAERDPYGEQAESMRRLAEGALEEALRRPTFAIAHPVKVSARRRSPLGRRKRAREEALAELREACQRARLEPDAAEQRL